MKTSEYIETVFEILETYDYPELIVYYNPIDVADTLARTMYTSRVNGISPRMCAIIIWSLTLNMKVIPDASRQTIH